ncbi:MAG: DUF1549 domain-containing protein, partial [Planctomycetes bacterium]|nr:DUF1549 domain-containing protein [Planctomycetota bacterium]
WGMEDPEPTTRNSSKIEKSLVEKAFHEKVAPILVANCLECHNRSTRKGNLSLEVRDDLMKGGDEGSSIIPGDSKKSLLIQKITSQSGSDVPEMPRNKPALSLEQVELIRQWIDSGADWPIDLILKESKKADASFWSFQPIKDHLPPSDFDFNESWKTHPIDRFLAVPMNAQKLSPNPQATPRQLIRRMTFDLTGLPPTPEEIHQFELEYRSDSKKGIESLIDRLLASPRYGEHWGRHWLDVIRFGESRGYERNEIITNLWPFRDYVIQSFNNDKPMDRFLREHLAGDVMEPDNLDVVIGSAFLVAGPYDDVGNQDAAAAALIRADQMDEMIRATSEGFLGLTMGCSRCHDHKFDPLLTKDYYSLFATFAGVVHGSREVAKPNQISERTGKLEPLLKLQEQLQKELAELNQELQKKADEIEATSATTWIRPRISRYGTEETFPTISARHIRLIVEGTDGTAADQGIFKIDEFEVWTDETESRNVALASHGGQARGDARQTGDFTAAYSASLTIDGKFGERWLPAGRTLHVTFGQLSRINRVFFSSDRNRSLAEDSTLTTFDGDYRIEVSQDGATWKEVANSFDRQPPTDLRKKERLLAKVTLPEDIVRRTDLQSRLAKVLTDISAIPPLPSWWIGTRKPAPGPFHVFVGGNPQRTSDQVHSRSLSVVDSVLPKYELDDSLPESERRLTLANWITHPDHPLTRRVLVNRIWKYHFGTGIVDTPSDFGMMGGRPTHPELLDYLATRLTEFEWHLKPLHKLIMTSQAYQQSSSWRTDAGQIDGDSRMLWRFPPRRLDAEEIRDSMLSVSGQLQLSMGGPGFKLYEYQQDNVATYVPLDRVGPETY